MRFMECWKVINVFSMCHGYKSLDQRKDCGRILKKKKKNAKVYLIILGAVNIWEGSLQI